MWKVGDSGGDRHSDGTRATGLVRRDRTRQRRVQGRDREATG